MTEIKYENHINCIYFSKVKTENIIARQTEEIETKSVIPVFDTWVTIII